MCFDFLNDTIFIILSSWKPEEGEYTGKSVDLGILNKMKLYW